MTDRIDHFAEARRVIMTLPCGDTLDQAYAYAQVHATLALVEQQQAANLMAYHGDFYHEQQQKLLERYPEVAAALGIEVQP